MTNIGRKFEKLFAKSHNLKEQPGSGNGKFFKLDVVGKAFLYSLKATKNKSFSITKKDLDEVRDATKGPGGTGAIPALVTTLVQDNEPSVSDPVYITLEFNDFKALLEEEAKIFDISVEEEKAFNSEIPSLFKDIKKSPESD